MKECANFRKNLLSAYYVHYNVANVRLRIKPLPGINKITLRELTAGIIRNWMIRASGSMSRRNIYNYLNSIRVPVHYAVDREELNRNPFRNIKPATDIPKEKDVLSVAERAKLINTLPANPRSRLAVLLGLLCGMRRGEV
jgi:integrase